MGKEPSSQYISDDYTISKDTDWAFLYTLQKGLLLALWDCGHLNEFQYRSATQRLREQEREYLGKRELEP